MRFRTYTGDLAAQGTAYEDFMNWQTANGAADYADAHEKYQEKIGEHHGKALQPFAKAQKETKEKTVKTMKDEADAV